MKPRARVTDAMIPVVALLLSVCLTALDVAAAGEPSAVAVPGEKTAGPSVGEYLAPDGRIDLEALRASGYEGPLDLEGLV